METEKPLTNHIRLDRRMKFYIAARYGVAVLIVLLASACDGIAPLINVSSLPYPTPSVLAYSNLDELHYPSKTPTPNIVTRIAQINTPTTTSTLTPTTQIYPTSTNTQTVIPETPLSPTDAIKTQNIEHTQIVGTGVASIRQTEAVRRCDYDKIMDSLTEKYKLSTGIIHTSFPEIGITAEGTILVIDTLFGIPDYFYAITAGHILIKNHNEDEIQTDKLRIRVPYSGKEFTVENGNFGVSVDGKRDLGIIVFEKPNLVTPEFFGYDNLVLDWTPEGNAHVSGLSFPDASDCTYYPFEGTAARIPGTEIIHVTPPMGPRSSGTPLLFEGKVVGIMDSLNWGYSVYSPVPTDLFDLIIKAADKLLAH